MKKNKRMDLFSGEYDSLLLYKLLGHSYEIEVIEYLIEIEEASFTMENLWHNTSSNLPELKKLVKRFVDMNIIIPLNNDDGSKQYTCNWESELMTNMSKVYDGLKDGD